MSYINKQIFSLVLLFLANSILLVLSVIVVVGGSYVDWDKHFPQKIFLAFFEGVCYMYGAIPMLIHVAIAYIGCDLNGFNGGPLFVFLLFVNIIMITWLQVALFRMFNNKFMKIRLDKHL